MLFVAELYSRPVVGVMLFVAELYSRPVVGVMLFVVEQYSRPVVGVMLLSQSCTVVLLSGYAVCCRAVQ